MLHKVRRNRLTREAKMDPWRRCHPIAPQPEQRVMPAAVELPASDETDDFPSGDGDHRQDAARQCESRSARDLAALHGLNSEIVDGDHQPL